MVKLENFRGEYPKSTQASISAAEIQPPPSYVRTRWRDRLGPVAPEVLTDLVRGWLPDPGSSTVQALNSDIEEIEKIYELTRKTEVVNFLTTYPFLTDLLLEAFGQVEKFFGLNPDVTLEVVQDLEATDERELVASIHTSLPPDEALDRLDQLDDHWWLDAMTKAQGNFCINLEFL